MKITRIGMDIAKSMFQLHFVASHDRAALKKKLKRAEVLAFFRATPACEVGIEACGGSVEGENLRALEFLLERGSIMTVNPMKLKRALCNIHPNSSNLHLGLPLSFDGLVSIKPPVWH